MYKYIKKPKFKPFKEALKEHKESKRKDMNFNQNINMVKKDFYKTALI